ncbi:hypothetical protein EC968_000496 [Mortierella alpina]|nr:hypothetical protein EC968_000496 [Mortierella alpina]
MSSRSLIALHQRTCAGRSIHSPQAVSARTITFSSQALGYYNSYSDKGISDDKDDKPRSNKPKPTSQKSASTETAASSKALDPDTIKGPGGLTMTQIGKLVQQSRARDLEQKALKQQQQQHRTSSKGSK